MKGGVAVQLKLAAQVREPSRDVTYVFYEGEEIDGEFNGLAHLVRDQPELLGGRLRRPAGTDQRRRRGRLQGHAARRDRDEGHRRPLRPTLERAQRDPRRGTGAAPAHGLRGAHRCRRRSRLPRGAAGRRHPGRHRRQRHPRPVRRHGQLPVCAGQVGPEAEAHVREVFDGFDVVVADNARGARPGLTLPAATGVRRRRSGSPVGPKEGWTDVARFSALGVAAVNFGPGDPNLAHTDDERAPVHQYVEAEQAMLRWLAMTDPRDRRGGRRARVTGARAEPPGRSGHPAGRPGAPDDHRPAAARRSTARAASRLAAHRPLAGAADPERVRRGVRCAGRAGPGGQRLRLRPHHAGRPRPTSWASRWAGPRRGRLRGDHRWRPRRHGGGQQGRLRGGRDVGRSRASSCPSSPGSTATSTSA